MRRVLAVLAVTVLLSALAPPSGASGFPGAGKCVRVDRTWNIQEAAVDVNTAKIDVFGLLCSARDGRFNLSHSTMRMTIRTTRIGSEIAGLKYWKTGGGRTESTRSFVSWRAKFKYCPVLQVPVIPDAGLCVPGQTGEFWVTARWCDPQLQLPFLVSRTLSNRNVWAHARWS